MLSVGLVAPALQRFGPKSGRRVVSIVPSRLGIDAQGEI